VARRYVNPAHKADTPEQAADPGLVFARLARACPDEELSEQLYERARRARIAAQQATAENEKEH